MEGDVKQLLFDCLPKGNAEWLVIGAGKIINEFKGSYKQQLILRKLSKNDDPANLKSIRIEKDDIRHAIVDIGSIRIFSPGTIVQNQRIKTFVEEYAKKKEIVIPAPQSLTKNTFAILGVQMSLPSLSDLQSINVRCFDVPGENLTIVIPCSVIVDYYFFGMTPLTKAVLDGMLDRKVKRRNTVFNPDRIDRDVSATNKKVAYVELGRKMFLEDKIKIGRLAHDDFFWSKCMGVFASLVGKKPNGSFIDTDFPVDEPVELSVYGVFVKGKFLVHSISRCSSKPPFDLLIAGKPFKGKSRLNGNLSSGNNPPGNKTPLTTNPPKTKSKTHLDTKNTSDVKGERPQWDAGSETLTYSRDQSSSFPDEDSINEQDLADAEKSDQVNEWIHKNGLALAFSTSPDKSGSTNSIQLNLSAHGPWVPPKQEPTTAFSIIEKLSSTLQLHFNQRKCNVSAKICCPVQAGDDKYSAFPVDLILASSEFRTTENVNFCFLKVREHGHTFHRRVFIHHLTIDGLNFYMMDVEPKYINKVKSRFLASYGVIFHTENELSEKDLIKILLQIVISRKTKDSGWKFLKTKFKHKFFKFQHRGLEISHHRILKFLYDQNVIR